MSLSISHIEWLAPAATACHFLEKWPQFAQWAREHILSRYTDQHWRRIHLPGMLCSIGFDGAVSWAPGSLPVFLFTALYLAPMLFNISCENVARFVLEQ